MLLIEFRVIDMIDNRIVYSATDYESCENYIESFGVNYHQYQIQKVFIIA